MFKSKNPINLFRKSAVLGAPLLLMSIAIVSSMQKQEPENNKNSQELIDFSLKRGVVTEVDVRNANTREGKALLAKKIENGFKEIKEEKGFLKELEESRLNSEIYKLLNNGFISQEVFDNLNNLETKQELVAESSDLLFQLEIAERYIPKMVSYGIISEKESKSADGSDKIALYLEHSGTVLTIDEVFNLVDEGIIPNDKIFGASVQDLKDLYSKYNLAF